MGSITAKHHRCPEFNALEANIISMACCWTGISLSHVVKRLVNLLYANSNSPSSGFPGYEVLNTKKHEICASHSHVIYHDMSHAQDIAVSCLKMVLDKHCFYLFVLCMCAKLGTQERYYRILCESNL